MNNKPQAYPAVLEAMAQPDCAACRLVDAAVRQRIDAFLYEQIVVVERRAEIRAARGFCSVHSTMLNNVGYMQGNAILQHDVLNDVLREISKVVPDVAHPDANKRNFKQIAQGLFNRAGAVVNAIKPRRMCVLCEYERDREAIYLRVLINHLHEPEFRAAFAASSGVCLPHFRVALELNEVRNDNVPAFIEIETAILSALKAELDEYLHKSNGSFGYTQGEMGDEADAPLRALKLVSGRVIHTDGR